MSDAEETENGSSRDAVGASDPGRIDPEDMDLTTTTTAHQGEHEVPDAAEQLGSLHSDDIRTFEWEDGVVLKQLSEFKYESIESWLREYITNAVATTLETKQYLDAEYSPLIHIAYYPTENRLIIEDNGMGMSDAEVENGRHGGRGTHTFDGQLPGKFGIGRYSGFTATGLDGAFFMETHSRRTGDHIKGAWVAEGFADDKQDDLPVHFADNRYGTRFEFPLKPEHADADIQQFVENKAFHARVPVLYTEHNADGTERFNEEYGGTYFTSEANPDMTIIYEDEYVRAVTGRRRDECVDEDTNRRTKTVQLDGPIDRNHDERLTRVLGTSTYVYLKTELAWIVEGPHKGLIHTSDAQYNDLSDEQKERHVPASACSGEDVWVATPAGDRDRLKRNDAFWEWLGGQLDEKGNERINRCLRFLINENILELSESDRRFITHYAKDVLAFKQQGMKTVLGRRTMTNPDDDEIRKYKWLLKGMVEVCEPGSDPRFRQNREKVPTWRGLDLLEDDTKGFVAIRPTLNKSRIVWADDEDNLVIRLKKSYHYDVFEDYGYRKLKEITTENVDEFDVSDELKQSIGHHTPSGINENAGRDGSDRKLTIHNLFYERTKKVGVSDRAYEWKHRSDSVIAEDVIEHLRWANDPDSDTGSANPYTKPGSYRSYDDENHTESVTDLDTDYDEIPLFPTVRRVVVVENSDDRNITDYYDTLGLGATAIVRCTKLAADYLRQSPHVVSLDEAIEDGDATFMTVDGEQTFRRICETYTLVMLHYLPEELLGLFRDPEMCERAGANMIHRHVSDDQKTTSVTRNETPDECVYLPIGRDDLDQIGVILGEFADDEDTTLMLASNHRTDVRHPQVSPNRVFRSNTKLYTYIKLPDWVDSSLFGVVESTQKSLRRGGRELVDCLAERHDEGLPPHGTGIGAVMDDATEGGT